VGGVCLSGPGCMPPGGISLAGAAEVRIVVGDQKRSFVFRLPESNRNGSRSNGPARCSGCHEGVRLYYARAFLMHLKI
jgi:hypothetical protein